MIQCQWCQAQNPPDATSCQTCGAASTSGTRSATPVGARRPGCDMTEFKFSGRHLHQGRGELVPVAEIFLHPQGSASTSSITCCCGRNESVPLSSLNTGGGMESARVGGMPHIVTVANGPGRIAFSRDAPGELRRPAAAPGAWNSTSASTPSWWPRTASSTRSCGSRASSTHLLHGGSGMVLDQVRHDRLPGHAAAAARQRQRARALPGSQGEKILVEPRRVPLQGLLGCRCRPRRCR